MKFLAITQKTADWLLRTPQAREVLTKELYDLSKTAALKDGVLAIGSLRACTEKSIVICIWNTDYISATGVEDWGFILLESQDGLFSNHEIITEVFERSLFVINQRLQGLLLPDDRLIHRSLGDNIHCCLSGRGASARQCSVGYVEGTYTYESSDVKSVLTIGPWAGSKDQIKKRVASQAIHIDDLINAANKILENSTNRPAIDSSAFLGLRDFFLPMSATLPTIGDDIQIVDLPELEKEKIEAEKAYQTLNWTYHEWIGENSPLTKFQRAIFNEDIILKQPLRLIGAAGSGKTLLMHLLCIKRLEEAKKNGDSIRILYVVHNNEMANTMVNRFTTLGADKYLSEESNQYLQVATLFGYSQHKLGLSDTAIIDKDAYQTKLFQRNLIKDCLDTASEDSQDLIKDSQFIKALIQNVQDRDLYADIIGTEIGVAIKGRDLGNDEKKYVTIEKPLSRLHAALTQSERAFLYKIYREYHSQLFESFETLDADDVAISLLLYFKTPLWEMRRKVEGFDFVFVDETQLFNENERCLFHLLTTDDKSYVPIALALDEAQALHGAITSGFGALGIENISNQMLRSVHRSTESILKLSFYLLQRTTDLFTVEFPDFTKETITLVSQDHPLATRPTLSSFEAQTIARSVLREVRALRKKNVRQIAIVVHTDKYWSEITEYFDDPQRQLPVQVQTKRGERISPDTPIVVITRPETVGGQEFDAVIAVGIEKGLVPPVVKSHSGLQTALEQQALREMYLSFTRARFILTIVNSTDSVPSPILQGAIDENLIDT